jgi:hypothetical protein
MLIAIYILKRIIKITKQINKQTNKQTNKQKIRLAWIFDNRLPLPEITP